MLRWIALLLLVLVIAAAAIFYRPETTDVAPGAVPNREPAAAETAPASVEPIGGLPEAVPAKVAAAGVTAPESTPASPEATPPVPAAAPHVVFLQQKYGDLPRAELLATLAELDQQVQEEQRRLLDERFQRGIYEVSLLGDPPLPLLEPGPDGKPPVSDNRAATDPGSGQTENRRTYLPFDEYADFYALQGEAAWLREFAGK
jgi:hypothetical protein